MCEEAEDEELGADEDDKELGADDEDEDELGADDEDDDELGADDEDEDELGADDDELGEVEDDDDDFLGEADDEDEDDGADVDAALPAWLVVLKPSKGSIPAKSDAVLDMPSELSASGICDDDIEASELNTPELSAGALLPEPVEDPDVG